MVNQHLQLGKMIPNPWANQSCPNGNFRSNCPRGRKCLYRHPGDDDDSTGPPAQVSIALPERRSGRRKFANKKYVNVEEMSKEPETSPLCVECKVYVDSGAFCIECQGWWHYRCAKTTELEVQNLAEKDFFCPEHSFPTEMDEQTSINTPSPINVSTPTITENAVNGERHQDGGDTESESDDDEDISDVLLELNEKLEKKSSIIIELEAELCREREKYQIKMGHLVKENNDLKEKSKNSDDSSTVKSLKEKLSGEKTKLCNMEKDLNERKKTVSCLGIQVNKLQTMNTQLKQKNENLEERIQVLKATNDSLESAVKLREDELSAVRQSLNEPQNSREETAALSSKCRELEIEQEELVNRIKSLENELASALAEKSQEENLNYLVISEYFDEGESQLEGSESADSSDAVTFEEEVNSVESTKIDTLMAKIVKMQDQLKEKNKEISNLKNNLAAQENLSKTYFNEIENLTIQLNAREADLTRSSDMVDLLISQQKDNLSGETTFVPSNEDLISRYENSEHDSVVENGSEPINGARVIASHVCPLFFRYGDETCPGEDTCGRSHNPEVLQKKGVCFKDFEREGSCPRNDQCWFSHDTPPELRTDADFKNFMRYSMEKMKRKKLNQRSRNPVNEDAVQEVERINNSDENLIDQVDHRVMDIGHEGTSRQQDESPEIQNANNSDQTERSQTFLDQRQIMHLIQQQVQSSLSSFMSQICPQLGWNSTVNPMVMGLR